MQADVRELLLSAPLGLDEHQVVSLEAPVGDRRRIDVEVGSSVGNEAIDGGGDGDGVAEDLGDPRGVQLRRRRGVQESVMAEVGVAELRRELKRWVERVQAGEEVVITDRGRPVARLIAAGVPSALERLTAQGRVSRPAQERPSARGLRRVGAQGAVSEYVTSEREARRA